MKATVLIDNIASENLASEWGLSILIEYEGKKYLLDTGSSKKYLENAKKLGISLEDVELSVLSHAHYDHSGGYRQLFECNPKTKLYVSSNCKEDCYGKKFIFRKYIGVPRGVLGEYKDRIEYVDGFAQIAQGVYLVPHLENGLAAIGKAASLYRKDGRKLVPDDFRHEQSLVFETEKGLVVFNSCSHAGVPNIMKDIEYYLPGKKVYMTVGGMHMFGMAGEKVREIANLLKGLGIEHIITGHCTGQKAYEILKDELGDGVEQIHSGLVVEV